MPINNYAAAAGAGLLALGLMGAAPADAVHDLAPQGTLRAAMNYGNPVLTSRDPATGKPGGVAVALAYELGRQLGVPVTLVPYEEAGQVTKATKSGAWDIAFLAIDPVRAADITFTKPYVVIEGVYLVRSNSPLHQAPEVDRDGVRVAVSAGSAYDLYLTRALKHAELIRLPTSDAAVGAFEHDHLEVLAGVKQPLAAMVKEHADLRLLDGAFMSIQQAMCLPQGHPAGAAFLESFVAQQKASGFVANALRESGHADVSVPGM
jgi:polar amino acid transport system substrate-binding protein